ncbi:hypothetical protein RAS1_30150 [Phycisphaerae bacterium RAS1]|nr:hypothetical protein RAS1_30150 [Phycisphaerae bacterium RAS1]
MHDRTVRLALVLALLFFLTGLLLVLLWIGASWSADAVQVACIVDTLVAFVALIGIWRRYVRWTVLRSIGTLGATALLLLHAVLWVPLLPVGCVASGLCFGQSALLGGFWAIACCLVWWGPVLWPVLRSRRSRDAEGGLLMTRSAVRCACSFALFPLLAGTFTFTLWGSQYWSASGWPLPGWLAYQACAVVTVLLWFLVWRRSVRWTRRRVLTSVSLGALVLLSPLGVLAHEDLRSAWRGYDSIVDAIILASPLFAGTAFLAGTAWSWRLKPAEAAARVAELGDEKVRSVSCPACRYSLRGLPEARCPECGWSGTIDEIVERSINELIEIAA